jgi:hypothetical protein
MGPPETRPKKAKPLTSESLAAHDVGVSKQLGYEPKQLARYGIAKARNHQMAGHLAVLGTQGVLARGYSKLASKLYQCGSYLLFRHYMAHSETRLIQSYSCDVALLCPLCAIRRAAKHLRRYVERCELLAGAHDFYLVTLTVKNGPDLEERYRHLVSSWKRLNHRAKKGYGVYADASGSFGSVEFTKSEAGWHPHMHMIWAMPKGSDPVRYGKDSQLALDWLAATGDSFIVHAKRIEAAEGAPAVNGEVAAAANDPLIAALCETLKYALKFSDLSLTDNVYAFECLRGKRLTRSYGCFYGLEVPERLDDDELDGPFIDLIYRFMGSRGYILQAPGGNTTLTP